MLLVLKGFEIRNKRIQNKNVKKHLSLDWFSYNTFRVFSPECHAIMSHVQVSKMNYSPMRLSDALKVIAVGTTIRGSSKEYNIPATTLHNTVSGRSEEAGKPGRKTALPYFPPRSVLSLKI